LKKKETGPGKKEAGWGEGAKITKPAAEKKDRLDRGRNITPRGAIRATVEKNELGVPTKQEKKGRKHFILEKKTKKTRRKKRKGNWGNYCFLEKMGNKKSSQGGELGHKKKWKIYLVTETTPKRLRGAMGMRSYSGTGLHQL